MTTKTPYVIGAAVAGVAGLAVWLITRKSAGAKEIDEEIEKEKEGLLLDYPDLSDEEAEALAALEASKKALLEAQQAKYNAMVAEQAEIVRQMEAQLALLQSRAILDAEAAAAAAEAEAIAEAARQELLTRTEKSLNQIQNSLEKAEEAAIVATDAYLAAKRRSDGWFVLINDLKQQIMDAEQEIADMPGNWWLQLNLISRRKALNARIESFDGQLRLLEPKADAAFRAMTAARLYASQTINNSNFIIERKLTELGELQLLGILLALANRVDAIAIAVRIKVRELEASLDL